MIPYFEEYPNVTTMKKEKYWKNINNQCRWISKNCKLFIDTTHLIEGNECDIYEARTDDELYVLIKISKEGQDYDKYTHQKITY